MTPVVSLDRRAAAGADSLSAGFVLERNVGHAALAAQIENGMAAFSDIEARYVPVTFHQPGGLVERLPLPSYLRASYRARLQVRRGLGRWKPDVIFWNTQKPAVLCPDVLRGSPSVICLDVTPLQYDEIGETYGHAPDRLVPVAKAKHATNRWIFRHARRLVPWTEWAAHSLANSYGVPTSNIEVIPPGTDLARFRPIATRPSETGSPVRLLFVGGDFVRKGGDVLLEWFRTSPAAKSCVLHLVTRDEVPSMPGVVKHSLAYEDERLTELYRTADIFVMPTRAECFGIVLTEAMACAAPVVTCPVGGVPEVVRDHETGLMVKPGDVQSLDQALTKLVRDAELRRRLGLRGRAVAEERFDTKKNVARIVEVLRSVAAEDRQRSGRRRASRAA